jgi:hypothetical protein
MKSLYPRPFGYFEIRNIVNELWRNASKQICRRVCLSDLFHPVL